MALHKFPAIVLQSYETGESSEAIRIFSGAHGRLGIMAKGIRRPKSKYAGILQPLALVELSVSWREGTDMATLREASTIDDRHVLQGDLERVALASLLVEIAAESCDVGQPSEEMFEILCRALDAIDPRADQSAPAAAAHFLLQIIAIAGYEPHIDPAALKPWPSGKSRPRVFFLDVHQGRVHLDGAQPIDCPEWPIAVHPNVRHVPIPPEAVRALYERQQVGDVDLGQVSLLESAKANVLIDALARVAQWHLGHSLRSARFWKSVGV